MTDVSKVRSSEASLIPCDFKKATLESKAILELVKSNSITSDTPTNDEGLTYKNANYGNNSLWVFSNQNPFRQKLQKLLERTCLSYAVNIVIILNSIFLIFETIDVLRSTGEYANYVFVILYAIECGMKIVAHGFILGPYTYLRDVWNWIDLFVVVTGLISFDPNIQLNFLALRTFRLIKPLKSLSFFPSMRVFISTLIVSMLDLFTIYFMMVFFFFLFALLGLTLWTERFNYRCRTSLEPVNQSFEINPIYSTVLCGGQIDCGGDRSYCINSLNYYPDRINKKALDKERSIQNLNWGLTKFGNLFQSLFVVFLTTTGEGWSEIMIMYMNGYNYFVSFIYFVLSVVINYYFIINLSVAAMLYNFENAQQVNLLYLKQKMQKENNNIQKTAIPSSGMNTQQHHNNNHNQTKHRLDMNEDLLRSSYRLKYIPINTMSSKSRLKLFDCVSWRQIQCFERIDPQTEYHAKFPFGFLCYYIYQQPFTQYFFYICIIINFILLALDRVNMGKEEARIVDILNITIVSIFVFEIVLLMFAVGLYSFIRSAWNIIDTIIILVSLIEIIIRKARHETSVDSVLTVLLLVRIIRLFKLFRRWHNFKVITESIGHTITKMVDYLFLFFLFIYMYTLLGCSFFSKASPNSIFNFDSFISSLISVIRIIIGDKWQEIFFDIYKSPQSSNILAYLFFISLIFLGQITLLNIFIAYLIDNFHKTKKQFDRNITVQNYIMRTLHFCLKEHQMEMKSSNKSTFIKREKKKKIKILNQYLQRLQNKEILSEGVLEFMHKNKINLILFEVVNELEIDLNNNPLHRVETIKVMNFEKRMPKRINVIDDCYNDRDYEEDFHCFNLYYYQRPEFPNQKSLIAKITALLGEDKDKEIKKSLSCPNLTKASCQKSYRRHNKISQPIFKFDSSSSSINQTIHQSDNDNSNDNDEFVAKAGESYRPLKKIGKPHNSNYNHNRNNSNAKLNKSDSVIENDDIDYSKSYSDDSEMEKSFEKHSRSSSVYSEPESKHKLTLVSKKPNRLIRFKTTVINLKSTKHKLHKEKSTIESIEEESQRSSIMNIDSRIEYNKHQITLQKDSNWKEKLIPITEHMRNSSLFIFHKNWKIRLMIRKLVYKPFFNYIILALIILNCIILCIDTPWVNPESVWADIIYGFNLCFNILFIIECLLKVISDNFIFKEKEEISTFKSIKYIIDNHETLSNSNSGTNDPTSFNSLSNNSANMSWNKMKTVAKEQYISKANYIINKRKAYLLDPVNIIDFICIILSIVDMSITKKLSYLRVLRVFRAIKPIRILTKSDNLKMMVECLIRSVPALANVILICFIFIFVYALFGVSLFKKDLQYYCTNIAIKVKDDCISSGFHWYKNPNNFDNFFIALKTNFLIMLADNWGDMMASAGQIYNNRWVYWYYVIHVFIGYLFILNLLVSVLIQNFKYLKQKEKTNKALSLPEKEWIHIQKMMVKVRPKYKKAIDLDNGFEVMMKSIVQSKWFNHGSLILTSLSLFVLMWQHENSSKEFLLAIDVISYVLTFLFNVEIILKIMLLKRNFFHSVWDDLDLFILFLCDLMVILNILTAKDIINVHAVSILPFILRSFRILRVLRSLSSFGKLTSVIDTLLYLIPSIGSIGIIVLLLMMIYANVGMNVFGTLPFRTIINDNINFKNIISSALLLFQVATKDNIGELLNEISYHDCRNASSAEYQQDYFCFKYNITCYDDYLVNYTSMTDFNMFSCGSDFSYFFLISFALLCPLFVMNLCIVIVVEGFSDSMKDNEGLFTRDYIDQFIATWIKYDCNYERIVKPHELALIMKEVQPSIGINYDRTKDNMTLASQSYRDRINSYKEVISLIKQDKTKLKTIKTSETMKRNFIKEENKCFIINGSYFSEDLKTFTTDREVLMICNKLNLGYIDLSSEIKQKDIKEPITRIEPIDVIDKEYYIHFIDACLALSRFSICKMMNVDSSELRLNVVGSYMKKIWNKKYKRNKDIISAFYEVRKQRERISPILATKIIYNKLIKSQLQNVQERLFDNQMQVPLIETDNQKVETINENEQLFFDDRSKKDGLEQEKDKEMDQIIKNDFARSSLRKHTGSIGNMSYFYNMKQISQDTASLHNQKNIVSIKRLSSFIL